MRSVIARRHGGPEVLEVADGPVPAVGPGEVLIRSAFMAVSGPDMVIRDGTYHWCPPLPVNPGNELTGFVEAVGEKVGDLRPGQRVLLSSRELAERGGCYT